MQIYDFSQVYAGPVKTTATAYIVRERTAAAHAFIVRKNERGQWFAFEWSGGTANLPNPARSGPHDTRQGACLAMSSLLDQDA
jgi:hypothetical protein